MTGSKKSTASSRWGYGWVVGKKDKQKEAEEEAEMSEKMDSQVNLPLYQGVVRRDTRSTQASRSTQKPRTRSALKPAKAASFRA
jgi:Xaa-Pro aminopeptidase